MSVYGYLKYNLHNHPAVFMAFAFGLTMPVMLLGIYPYRREAGYKRPVDVPRSFPLPLRAREPLSGYDD
ncbi:hypothetical protein BCR33DRAFT_785808 [Rhizoclosmatium globosum]|uniref:NADH-ubiquinone oxidoreductase 9.5 kDa subunit n=1 Tax=Rhizoclosmatium globosum TaxID=329046 RepID=A0A1Y2C8U4_9FUNG|nr:hypothetical protein HDU99_000987 [Rhizoclosmatium hyalinum]KAJ3297273.1 hypothetical protein HDU79_004155 [Rhizoclosmatium sp. JEL0117]ORY43449.1 hypothetical protein BCR33DRAFT_785808 [Rhizoclosmatium globosum]|eukprot:ORY43449.1 hypothetical protein BCR33DRAFT_785808 [Rhizoclosmatium globosum]